MRGSAREIVLATFAFSWIPMLMLIGVMLFLVERLRGGVLAAVAAHFGFNGGDVLVPSPGLAGTLLEMAVLVLIATGAAVVYLGDRKKSGARRSDTSN
jgi:energy-converting hydrogenase Eha subunit B